jgi:hypothetical protein
MDFEFVDPISNRRNNGDFGSVCGVFEPDNFNSVVVHPRYAVAGCGN